MNLSRLVAAILLVLTLGAVPAWSAITFDAASRSATEGGTSVTWDHTVGASVDILVVGVSVAGTTGGTTATYNGVSMTSAGSRTWTFAATDFVVELFYLSAPATGTHTVVLNNAGSTEIHGGAVSYSGVHQGTPFGTLASANGTLTTATVDVGTSSSDETVVDVVFAQNGGGTATANHTERWQINIASHVHGQQDSPGGGTVTMSWTEGLIFNWGIIAGPLQPASAGGYILTEAGDCINAENADRLITEDVSAGVGPCGGAAVVITPQRTLMGVGQ